MMMMQRSLRLSFTSFFRDALIDVSLINSVSNPFTSRGIAVHRHKVSSRIFLEHGAAREDNPEKPPGAPRVLSHRTVYCVDQVTRRKKTWSGNLNVCWSNRGDGRGHNNRHPTLEEKNRLDESSGPPEVFSNRRNKRTEKLTLGKKK
ncbi:hypothetical protein Trydic_g14502 [Trypoxylus dichotomus]